MRFFWAVTDADVRHLLPEIHVPTLVVHAARDLLVPEAQGRYVAEHIIGAEFVSLDSDIHLICVSDVLDQVADAVTGFLGRVLSPALASTRPLRRLRSADRRRTVPARMGPCGSPA